MSDPGCPLPIHSLAEAHLYLTVTPCKQCGGPSRAGPGGVGHDAEARVLAVPAECGRCGLRCEIQFDTGGIEVEPGESLAEAFGSLSVATGPEVSGVINPTDEPSRIIDVAGWLTLYTMIVDAAGEVEDRVAGRQLQLQAGQCLDEALKFYAADNDLPGAGAFFSDDSRRQFRDRPEFFARDRLMGLRAKLPVQGRPSGGAGEGEAGGKSRWWRRSKR